MTVITGITRGGDEWTPAFVSGLDQGQCIGCGRCFKVCPRDVFELVEREADEDEWDDCDDDDDFSDDTSMVMSLMNDLDCVGCQACSKVCSKKCLTHASAELAS